VADLKKENEVLRAQLENLKKLLSRQSLSEQSTYTSIFTDVSSCICFCGAQIGCSEAGPWLEMPSDVEDYISLPCGCSMHVSCARNFIGMDKKIYALLATTINTKQKAAVLLKFDVQVVPRH
jgi:hypothetical protein